MFHISLTEAYVSHTELDGDDWTESFCLFVFLNKCFSSSLIESSELITTITLWYNFTEIQEMVRLVQTLQQQISPYV